MDGILLLNKPQNMTSHDCVNKVRKIFKTKKVGHLGTLDPDVTGVLPIAINRATKIIQFLDQANKEYLAEVKIGFSTVTEDASGEVLECDNSIKSISNQQLNVVLQSFIGKQKQTPPLISAVKVQGKRLYEYARENKIVERLPRDIEIFDIELLSEAGDFVGQEITFIITVKCSKGTYIRTLATDIGKSLGYPAHLNKLIRLKSGKFPLNQSYTFTDIEKGNFELISLYDALESYHRVLASDQMKADIKHGKKISYQLNKFTLIVFYDIFKQVLAVYEPDKNNQGLIKPVRVLFSE